MIPIALASAGTDFFQQIEQGITLGAIYATVALGYTLVYGIIELINFAHADVMMVGTMVTILILNSLGLTSSSTALVGISLIIIITLTLAISMGTSALLNTAIERIAYRPLRKAPRLSALIAAIGVSFILEHAITLIPAIGTQPFNFPSILPQQHFEILGVRINNLDILIFVISLLLMIGLNRFITTTKLGRAMRSTAQDPEAAALMGVNINRTIALTFFIGGALAGAAGIFFSLYVGSMRFDTGFEVGLIAFTAAVLGGIGNVQGAVLGGFLIGIIRALVIQYVPGGSQWSLAIVFVILVLILALRPSGLLGQQVPDKV